MAKEKAKTENQKALPVDVVQEDQQVFSSTEESDETIVDEIAEKDVREEPLVKTDEKIAAINVVENSKSPEIKEDYTQIDFEEDEEFDAASEAENTLNKAPGSIVSESKYAFSEKALEEYLSGDKQDDRIVQESRFGNFVSNRTHEIYVPLSLFLK